MFVGDRVALKRVSEDPRNPGTGMRVDALREIKLLQELRHKNVVPLLDVYKRDQAVELVFPFAPRDLKQVRSPISAAQALLGFPRWQASARQSRLSIMW